MARRRDDYRSPNDETTIELDPNNDGRIVRKAFLVESFLNLFTLPLITHPHTVLPYLHINTSHTGITAATAFWSRVLGSIIIGALTVALCTAIPNTKTAIESRRTVYTMLAGGELALIALLVSEAMKGGGRDAALSVNASLMSIASLVPLVSWRVYVLFVKPEMIGCYREVKRE